MLSIPFLVFWVLLILARKELGWKWILALVLIWMGLLAGFVYLDISPYIFMIAEVLIDVVLIIVFFGGDIPIR